MHTIKTRVGVLMGGKSIEREVSFNSGRTICDHLDSSQYEVIPIFQQSSGALYLLPWRFLSRGKISDFEHRLATEATSITWDDLPSLIDFVYIAMHGRYAEDGTLQGMLALLGIPYLGAKLLGSAIGMDKAIQKKILAAHGIAVPHGIVLEPHEIQFLQQNPSKILNIISSDAHPSIQTQAQGLHLPLIIKPHKEGSSLGMSVVKKEEELLPALIAACHANSGIQQSVMVEEKIEGMEFTCIILTNIDGSPLFMPPTEIVHEAGSDFYTYDQKYMPGRAMKYTPARCTDDEIQLIQQTCLRVMHCLEFSNMARIDGFLTPDKRVVIIDPNTLTGMGPSSFIFRQAAEVGMSHTKLINHLIETELAHGPY